MEAVLLMAGMGSRFGGSIPKQFQEINGKKIYLYALHQFLETNLFDQITLVCHPDWIEQVESETEGVKIIAGGATRQESSYRGLLACDPTTTHVVIHDGVRPFVSSEIIRNNVIAVRKFGAVDTCIPSADTIVYSKSGDKIDEIPSRAHYLRGQTPQSFAYELILQAHQSTQRTNASDDCSLIRDMGHEVHIVQGSEENIKITTEMDLFAAKAWLKSLDFHLKAAEFQERKN